MQKIFLLLVTLMGIFGCASGKKENIWINPKIPMNAQAEQYYQTLNLCLNIANNAYPQHDTNTQQNTNLNAALSQFAQAHRWKQMRDDCMRGHGWILTTQEKADAIASESKY